MRESDVVRDVLEVCRYYPELYCWRNNTQGTYSKAKGRYLPLADKNAKGVADILGIISPSGTFLAVECKVPKRRNTVTVEQKKFINLIERFGGFACVVTSGLTFQEEYEAWKIVNERSKQWQ